MKILFQGDSITDAGRNTDNGSLISIGQGYAFLACSELSVEYPGKYEFENYGVSGNRVVDVYARIKKDIWNRQPDILSLLIGVNDVWHDFAEEPNGVDAVRFKNVYRMLVSDTIKQHTGIHMILMEPFVLRASKTEQNWDSFYSEVRKRAIAVNEIAEEFQQSFLPLQRIFDSASKTMPASYWLGDGVHPTPAGHQLIANEWIRLFKHRFEND